jgi:hypothetical protein
MHFWYLLCILHDPPIFLALFTPVIFGGEWAVIAQSVQRLGYVLDDRGSRIQLPGRAGNFSLHHRVQNGSGVHQASYRMGIRGSFPDVKRPGREADHLPPSSVQVKRWVELYLHSPILLHGVVLSLSTGTTLCSLYTFLTSFSIHTWSLPSGGRCNRVGLNFPPAYEYLWWWRHGLRHYLETHIHLHFRRNWTLEKPAVTQLLNK